MRVPTASSLHPKEWLPFLPGLLFLAISVRHTVVSPGVPLIECCLCWLPPILLLGVAIVIRASSLSPTRNPRILGWGLLGFGIIGIIIAGLMASPGVHIDSRGSIVAGLGAGTFGGMLAGFNEGRAINRGRKLERERLTAEQAQEEKSRLEHLNHLLRHDILNSVMVIEGYSDLLQDDLPEEKAKHIRTIHRQAKSVEELIQNVRSYMQALDEDQPLQTQNLSQTLRKEVESVQSTFPEAEVSTEIPDNVTVEADALLGSVFSNLLRNAIVHNRRDTPELSVTVESSEETATVRISDNGPGIPEGILNELEHPPEDGNHGFGLYLVQTLVNRYGGSLTFETTSEEGTTVTVSQPHSETPPGTQINTKAETAATGT